MPSMIINLPLLRCIQFISGHYTEDATDGSLSLNVDPQTSRSLVELATVLREDISRIITFSNNEMQVRTSFDRYNFNLFYI